ncbi:hypothetical protein ELE36_11695 [Pseudolysobacter antarcticus]|uniref:Integrase catalytic domain-containing protein n=1 Tax=Pseudolysobacter antarcticus TaxID=2511995 RepID=A0A411HKE0_9GAMM|nr:hypothetical protein [Pseudolysobacter antarcticus]QBB70958.1 hypothetical protein ELE36_11695 [Pseudolysobacter antarcticus]
MLRVGAFEPLKRLVGLATPAIDLRGAIFDNRDEARSKVFDDIEVFYNRERLHSRAGRNRSIFDIFLLQVTDYRRYRYFVRDRKSTSYIKPK